MYVKASGKPVFDANGEFRGYRGTGVDVTEHKRAEQALRRSEVYLAEAQRLSHTGSFGWTPSTGELRWSEEIYRILEYDPRIEPTIERVLQRIHPDDLVMMRRALDQTSRGEKDFDITHRLLTPDGSVKFVHVLSHVLKDGAGNLEIVGALMDVTENTRLYRDLAEREAERSALRRGQHNRHLCIGISKAGSSRPTTHFSEWWATNEKISSRVVCAGPVLRLQDCIRTTNAPWHNLRQRGLFSRARESISGKTAAVCPFLWEARCLKKVATRVLHSCSI